MGHPQTFSEEEDWSLCLAGRREAHALIFSLSHVLSEGILDIALMVKYANGLLFISGVLDAITIIICIIKYVQLNWW